MKIMTKNNIGGLHTEKNHFSCNKKLSYNLHTVIWEHVVVHAQGACFFSAKYQ